MNRPPTRDDAMSYWYTPSQKDKEELDEYLLNVNRYWCLSDEESCESGESVVAAIRRANTFTFESS